jgi:hypothetical protein
MTSKRWATAGIATALVAAGVFVMVSSLSDNDNDNDNGAQAKSNLPADTADVTKQTLVDKETHDGSLTYTDTSKIKTKLNGTLTGLAATGSTVKRGQALYKIDDQPVVVLYGSLHRPRRPVRPRPVARPHHPPRRTRREPRPQPGIPVVRRKFSTDMADLR